MSKIVLLEISVAKPSLFFQVEPNFGRTIWVELGQVGPTMDEMFSKCIYVPAVFAGHNCWLFSRRDQFVLYIAVLHTVVKNRLGFSFSNAYLIKCLHLLGWNVLFLLGSFSSYSNIAKLAFSIQKKKIS